MKQNKEVRLSELRFEETDDKMILEGYAILFENETLIGSDERGFKEVIDRNALAETLMKDVPMKYNHMDSFLIIARTKNKSLSFEIDNIGLKIHAELLDTHSNEDVYKMVRAGLLDKMSFAFTVSKQSWDRSGKVPVRRILGIERLYDVSVVDTPAYEGTSIYARSLDLVESELKAMDLVEQEVKVDLLRRKIKIKSKTNGGK
ncbi:HK97 family phage prohead protease [Acholeplasma sp. OttesenSCG-928-E16]|nr:HK97 family phage prohead protease [Acholeplasma sp. OttesenSCG-928-E16]